LKRINDENYLTIGEMSKHIGRGSQTIKNWYAWAEENESMNLLPVMHTDLDAKGTRYFKEDAVAQLAEFRDSIKYGMMADISRQKWGKRGQEQS
jgi:hypothetical protein